MPPDLSIHTRPVEILQKLIRFNTTNPPGDEAECIGYVRGLPTEAGIESTVLERTKNRPNLVARIPGAGKAPPLLLYGHVDVVTTENQNWDQAPFGGEIIDGMVWGRGALDMKGGVAMMVSAFLRATAEGLQPPGDIILAFVSDEEAGGDDGAKFLVEHHADLFKGVRYALGEFGGFSLHVGGKRFYPIMVAEKQICWTKVTVRGQGGHGSLPVQGGAMAKLAQLLKKLDEQLLPIHITPAARMMFEPMAAAIGGVSGTILKQLTNPALANSVPLPARAQEEDSLTVLIVNSYDENTAPYFRVRDAFMAELQRRHATPIALRQFNLDERGAAAEVSHALRAELLRTQYAEKRPDLVVALGPPAVGFWLEHRDPDFAATPFIASASEPFVSQDSLRPADAAVVNRFTFSDLVENILGLLPETSRIFIILGASAHERRLSALAKSQLEAYAGRVEFEYPATRPAGTSRRCPSPRP